MFFNLNFFQWIHDLCMEDFPSAFCTWLPYAISTDGLIFFVVIEAGARNLIENANPI